MPVALATFLLYLACVGFYQAGATRTSFQRLKTSAGTRQSVRLASWLATLAALVLLAQSQGWERGVPVWLGLFTLAGIASLLVSALAPHRHLMTAAGSAAGAAIAGIGLLWGAMA